MAKKTVLKKIQKLAVALKESGVNIKALYLYGSHAKGRAGRNSDIDVAIISENFSGNFSVALKPLLPALRKSDSAIEPVLYRPKDFQEEDPLVWEILHNGIKISTSV
jgi:predicted nucleotidyltransferase